MGDTGIMKLNPDKHLILEQSLLRLPNELLRKNLKTTQFAVEKDSMFIKTTLKDTASASLNNTASLEDTLKSLNIIIARTHGLKRKLSVCKDEEDRLNSHLSNRVVNLSNLHSVQTFQDIKYDEWSRTRLDRLITDWCLRNDYNESAKALAQEKGIIKLVDCDTFIQMNRIRTSILCSKTTEALAWCQENKKELRKINSKLEFMLRFQQFIELTRSQRDSDTSRAVSHFRKFLAPMRSQYPAEIAQAGGLLVLHPQHFTPRKYQALYSQARWLEIAKLFGETHDELLNLHSRPLLHVALAAGLSALKTPACHATLHHLSATDSSTSPVSKESNSPVCPICSTELKDLARYVPYAQHNKSHVDPDVVKLPNGRVYGLSRIEEHAKKAGQPGRVMDPITFEFYDKADVTKVYIS